MDKHRQMPVKVIHLPISLLKSDFRIDVRDARRKDRQLELWHSEIVATFGNENHPFFLSSNGAKSSHLTSLLSISTPEGSGVLGLYFFGPLDYRQSPKIFCGTHFLEISKLQGPSGRMTGAKHIQGFNPGNHQARRFGLKGREITIRLTYAINALDLKPFQGSPLGRLWGKSRISKLAVAEFAKQMLHMPGVIHSSPPFPADTFQMAKTDDYFHCEYLIVII